MYNTLPLQYYNYVYAVGKISGLLFCKKNRELLVYKAKQCCSKCVELYDLISTFINFGH